jgi:hypothetical protein
LLLLQSDKIALMQEVNHQVTYIIPLLDFLDTIPTYYITILLQLLGQELGQVLKRTYRLKGVINVLKSTYYTFDFQNRNTIVKML